MVRNYNANNKRGVRKYEQIPVGTKVFAPERLNRPPKKSNQKDAIPLTGWINGKPNASDIEERFSRSLRRYEVPFSYEVDMATQYSVPTEEKNVDFLVFLNERVYPTEIHGEIGHEGSTNVARDAEREQLLNSTFRNIGYEPLTIVWYYDLEDQESADDIVSEIWQI